jgi:hypothetical protein
LALQNGKQFAVTTELQDALREVEGSLQQRQLEQQQLGEHGGHRERQRRELNWKKELEDRLKDVGNAMQQNAPEPHHLIGGAMVGIGTWMMYIGGGATALLAADDVTGVGVLDDPLMVGTGALFALGGILVWAGN